MTESRVGNFGDFVAKLEQFGEPTDVEARIDGVDFDAQFVREFQVSSAEVIHVHADNVRQIEQHVRNVLSSAN